MVQERTEHAISIYEGSSEVRSVFRLAAALTIVVALLVQALSCLDWFRYPHEVVLGALLMNTTLWFYAGLVRRMIAARAPYALLACAMITKVALLACLILSGTLHSSARTLSVLVGFLLIVPVSLLVACRASLEHPPNA